ncbi:hypothetical protein PX701_10605 [Agromyces sp. H3Y2-19a]|uniref:hypothetical protein n=1 Tax=Agromyces TaxID=33877 RepID=UPI001E4CDE21|nr:MULTISPECIES: hypothetical protein [Agromyces]MCD5348326.1 hypothetical protein [Agromyces sp. S2-1-8]MDF0514069.1 hypothetical protein [Agromyces chromiiresistens]
MDHIEALRRLAIADERLSSEVFGEPDTSSLTAKSLALSRLGALAGVGGTDASFAAVADAAVRAGASTAELVHVVVGVVPIVGAPRAVAAAQHLAVALGLDLETFITGDA